MDDLRTVAPRPGKAALRHGYLPEGRAAIEDGDELVLFIRGTESGDCPPLESSGESLLGPGANSQRALAKTRSDLTKALMKDSVDCFCTKISPRLHGLILLNVVMLACASTFVVLKEGQENFDPFIFSSLRFVIAAAAFSPFWRRAVRDERVIRAGLEIGIWAAGGYLTQSVGMVTADASRGAFLSAFTVVVVPMLGGMLGSVKLKRVTWISVVSALLGVMLLEDSGAPPSWGDFWSFASAVLFGIQIFRTEHWSRLCGTKDALPMMSIALLMIAALSVLSMLFTFPTQSLHLLQHPRALDELVASTVLPWPAILYMGLMVTDLGLWAEVVALQHVSSTEAAVIYTLEPVCGAAFAYVLLGERWGFTGWIGAILIVTSCLATQMYGAEKE